jgi:hypothetical protein
MKKLMTEKIKSEHKIAEDIQNPYIYPAVHLSIYENELYIGQELGNTEYSESNDVVALSRKQMDQLFEILDKELGYHYIANFLPAENREIPDFNEQHMPGTNCW